MLTLRAALCACLAVAVAAPAVLAEDKAERVAKEIAKKETETRAAISKELSALATWCAGKNAIDDARAALALGLELAPGDKALESAKEKLKDAKKAPPKDYSAEYAKKKRAAYDACAKAIATLVVFSGKNGVWDRFEERVEQLSMKLGSEAGIQMVGAVYFEPYRKWFNAADAKKLQEGGEFHDGKWLDAKAVAKLDAEHSKWDNPWRISDDVHEIKTTAPLRTAKQLLIHVGAYREFFVKYVADGWELKKPEGKLPIIVTLTQKDFMEQLEKDGYHKKGEQIRMAAVYMHGSGPLNPVYATFEPRGEGGGVTEVKIDYVKTVLQHECTHQIATEYSYWNVDHGEDVDSQYWSVEGLATYMESWQLGRTGWKLTHPNPDNHDQGEDYSFAHCKTNSHLPQSLKGFFDLSHDNFVKADHYALAAGISYFLSEAEGRKYRPGFLKLCEQVHTSRVTKKTLGECFPGQDWEQMHKEYKQFIAGIKLDEVRKKN